MTQICPCSSQPALPFFLLLSSFSLCFLLLLLVSATDQTVAVYLAGQLSLPRRRRHPSSAPPAPAATNATAPPQARFPSPPSHEDDSSPPPPPISGQVKLGLAWIRGCWLDQLKKDSI